MSIFKRIADAIFGTYTPGAITRAELDQLIQKRAVNVEGQQNWRTSIVDLLKVLDVPSDLDARAELAHELGYKGKLDGSMEMNNWLHQAVMQKLCETGGEVPASFKD